MLTEKHYEFFKMIRLANGNLNIHDLFDFAEDNSIAFSGVDDFENTYHQLNKLGYLQHNNPQHLLQFTAQGEKVYKLYLREKRGERIEKWPKRNWIILLALSYITGVATPLIVQYCKEKIWPESNQSNKTIPIYRDSAARKK